MQCPFSDERHQKRLDYIVWHQDIITAAPTIDIEIFRIPGEGLFMASASFRFVHFKNMIHIVILSHYSTSIYMFIPYYGLILCDKQVCDLQIEINQASGDQSVWHHNGHLLWHHNG